MKGRVRDKFVVDASVGLSWVFDDEATPATDALFRRLSTATAVVPGWWYIELINVLALAERRGRIKVAKTEEFRLRLSALAIEVEQHAAERAFGEILPLCRAHGLTSYDALYLELALRRGLPLATLDAEMSRVGRRLGLHLLV